MESILHLLMIVIVIIGAVALVKWLLTKTGMTIPYPLMVVIWVLIAIICLWFISGLVVGRPVIL